MADISIVTLDSADTLNAFRCWRNLVFISASVGYLFYVDANSDFVYVKTTDGGQTWGSPNTIRTGTVRHFDVWYDQWTDGDSGTLIHTSYVDDDVDDQFYRSLDTSGDSLGTERTIKASTLALVTVSTSTSIAKMRGGNLYCMYKIAPSSSKYYTSRSTDGGVTWSDRTTAWDPAGTSSSDFACVFPGNEADSNDAWVIFQDISSNELFLKVVDDSADTVSTSSNILTIVENGTDGLQQWQWSGAIRHSDGHLILAVWNDLDLTVPFDGDFRVFDINGTGSITELTAIASNVPGAYLSAVFVDQNTDDLYVAYGGKLDGTENIVTFPAKIYYAKSTDGGSTWSTNQAFSASSSDYRSVRVPPSGNRFMGIWRNATTFELLTNYDNSLDLTPAAGGITGPLVGAGHLSGNGPLVGGRLVG